MDDLSRFTEAEFKKEFNNIVKGFFKNLEPSKTPKAYILGGQSGAGKSTLHQIIHKENSNVGIINGDQFRESHPNIKEIMNICPNDYVKCTQKFSNQVVENLIKFLSEKKYNLIIEGTLRTSDIPMKTCDYLKNNGYSVELLIIAVSKDLSWKGNIDRYNMMKSLGVPARITEKNNHDGVVKALPNNLDIIYSKGNFDNIKMYDREKNCLYNMKNTPEINPSKQLKSIINKKSYEKGRKNSLGKKIEEAKERIKKDSPDITKKNHKRK